MYTRLSRIKLTSLSFLSLPLTLRTIIESVRVSELFCPIRPSVPKIRILTPSLVSCPLKTSTWAALASFDPLEPFGLADWKQEGKQGAEMVRKVLKDNFDLDIKYYALVDFQAFATAIDTLFPDGVTIDAQFSTLNGVPVTEATVGDDLHATETESPTQTIKVGTQQMNGSTLLNYARFRDDDEGDYGRTRRQQQVMTAVLQQIKDPTKLFTGSEALGKVFAMTSTNLPYTFLLTNGLSVLEGGQNGIERLTVPELGDWVDDYDVYGGQALRVDQKAYQNKLAQMGFR